MSVCVCVCVCVYVFVGWGVVVVSRDEINYLYDLIVTAWTYVYSEHYTYCSKY